MRVNDPGNNLPPKLPVSSRTPGPPPHTDTPPSTHPATVQRIASLLDGLSNEIPAAELDRLASGLIAAGYGPGVDESTVVKALLLQRNGVPLSAAILEAPPEHAVLLPAAARLLDMALALLDEFPPDKAPASLKALVGNLEVLLAPHISGSVPANPEGITRQIRRNGLSFEWRLLAWYRSGREPGALNVLLRDDLKGTLLRFLAEAGNENARTNETLRGLAKDARALLDHLTGRQIDLLTQRTGTNRHLYFEVPFGKPGESMDAGIRVQRDETNETHPESSSFSLSMEIETTRLGPVRVHLRFIGKSLSATFHIRDRSARALAETMTAELRDMLKAQGYEPGIIRMASPGEAEESAISEPENGRLDRRG